MLDRGQGLLLLASFHQFDLACHIVWRDHLASGTHHNEALVQWERERLVSKLAQFTDYLLLPGIDDNGLPFAVKQAV